MHCKQRVRKGGVDTAFETLQARSSWRRLRATLVLVIAYLGISIPILADNFNWIGPDGGRWNEPANWQPRRLPGETDDVVIDGGQAGKVVLLENPKRVLTLLAKNIRFEPNQGFRFIPDAFDINITTTGDMTLEESVVIANPGTPAHPKGGDILLKSTGSTTTRGDLDIHANLTAGNGKEGGQIKLEAQRGSILMRGRIQRGDFIKAGNGAGISKGGGGGVGIEAAGDVRVGPLVQAGGGGPGNPGGKVVITSRTGKIDINGVLAGNGGESRESGGSGGSIVIWATAGNVELNAHVKGGDGGKGVNPGSGGYVIVHGKDYVGGPNSHVQGGNGGFGRPPVGFGFAGAVTLDFTGEVTNYGLIQGGDGREGAIPQVQGGKIKLVGGSVQAGKKLGGSGPGADTFGADTFGLVKISAQESITVDPDASIRGGWIDIVTSPGDLIDLQGLNSNAISADTSVRISVGHQSGQVVLLGAQSYAITAGVDICIFGRPILDDGVTLADVTDPEANNPSTPCPPPMGNPFQVTVSANPIWTDTGLDLTSNDQIQIRDAVGSWNWGTIVPDFGPDGYDISTSFPDLVDDEWITNGLHGQLIGVVLPVGMNPNMYSADEPLRIIPQDDPRLFEIGSDSVTLTGVSGRLWLGFNDDYEGDETDDNSGSVTVWIDLSQ